MAKDYSEYKARIPGEPSDHFSDCTYEEAVRVRNRLSWLIENAFPGVCIVNQKWGCVEGPDAETCCEMQIWIQENVRKAIVG